MKAARWALISVLALALLLPVLGCSGGGGWDGRLFDFERDAELSRFHWRCGQLFALSDEHATHGRHSLRLELYPTAPYPGLRPAITHKDWSRFDALCFDVYNPRQETVPLSMRIDDVRNRPDWGDRFQSVTPLAPGLNRVRVPLASLKTSGSGRLLDARDIWAVYIFLAHPKVKRVLYFDNIRLERAARSQA